MTCNSPVEVFLRAAGAFFPANSDSQMALAIFVMAEDLSHSLKELAFTNGSGFG